MIGFFLTRRELGIKSEREESKDSDVIFGLNHQPRFKRAFLFIVDALRLDFMVHHIDHEHPTSNHTGNEDVDRTSPYNRFTYMHQLLQKNASQTHLFAFRGDPPTVTSQRLKGLTTGTLPTFIDISSNFDGAAIHEDNIIDQALKHGMRLVFMGDDTWKSLYPTQFHVSVPFDSFNTKVNTRYS
jgi:GPI ethanolamine phosphate transferase 3 subunit O